jgi:hypothetical protein
MFRVAVSFLKKEKSPPVNVLNICSWKFCTYFPATGKYDVRELPYINLKRGADLIKSVYHGSLFNEVVLKVFNCREEKKRNRNHAHASVF